MSSESLAPNLFLSDMPLTTPEPTGIHHFIPNYFKCFAVHFYELFDNFYFIYPLLIYPFISFN